MNELIEQLFSNFSVNGVTIPVSFLQYKGHGEPYVTYMETNANNECCGDDELIGYAEYYDFDVYSKGSYTDIVDAIKKILKEHDFMFIPSMCSGDMYETDTGYYHKTLCFGILREEI